MCSSDLEGIHNPHILGVGGLFICGKVIEIYRDSNQLYIGDELLKITRKPDYNWWENKELLLINDGYSDYKYQEINYLHVSEDKYGIYPYAKQYLDKYPIFLIAKNSNIITPYPKLQALEVNKVIPANDIWIMLSQWLSEQLTKNESKVPVGDDKSRILSHGFDLKQSFRHRKPKE